MSARSREGFAWFFTALKYGWWLNGPRGIIAALRGDWVLPRPAYCECCKAWAWCTEEVAAYSTATGFLCEDCAIDNERETEHAWRSFYGAG